MLESDLQTEARLDGHTTSLNKVTPGTVLHLELLYSFIKNNLKAPSKKYRTPEVYLPGGLRRGSLPEYWH